MNVIPQSPPIKVFVTERDKEGNAIHEGVGRIVAWNVVPDGDRLDLLVPVIWCSGHPFAIPHDDSEVRYLED